VSNLKVEAYKRFWIKTTAWNHPVRFGNDWFCAALDALWEAAEHPKYQPRAVDWLGLESFVVDVLKSPWLTDAQKVQILREGIDAHTGRGHFTGARVQLEEDRDGD
jgi:hypothetical protein